MAFPTELALIPFTLLNVWSRWPTSNGFFFLRPYWAFSRNTSLIATFLGRSYFTSFNGSSRSLLQICLSCSASKTFYSLLLFWSFFCKLCLLFDFLLFELSDQISLRFLFIVHLCVVVHIADGLNIRLDFHVTVRFRAEENIVEEVIIVHRLLLLVAFQSCRLF